MNYIVIKRARFNSLSGEVNLRYGTEVECVEHKTDLPDEPVCCILTLDGKQLCCTRSQNAYDFFARNDDGKGLERGALTQGIKDTLEKRDENYQSRWDKVWSDPVCKKYKRKEHADMWLWAHNFYNAEIPDLQHIAALIGVKGVS